MQVYRIPLSNKDSYIFPALGQERHLRNFNNSLRGHLVPVGLFHEPSHEGVLFDLNPKVKADISHHANIYALREGRINARVLQVHYDVSTKLYMAEVEWNDDTELPSELRITAVLKGKRCVRVMHFGVELQ